MKKFILISTIVLASVVAKAGEISATADNASSSNFKNNAALELAALLKNKTLDCGPELKLKVLKTLKSSVTFLVNSDSVNLVDTDISMSSTSITLSGEMDPPDTTIIVIPRVTDWDAQEMDVAYLYFSNWTDLYQHKKLSCKLK